MKRLRVWWRRASIVTMLGSGCCIWVAIGTPGRAGIPALLWAVGLLILARIQMHGAPQDP